MFSSAYPQYRAPALAAVGSVALIRIVGCAHYALHGLKRMALAALG